MKHIECCACQRERERRARLIVGNDTRLQSVACLTAVYLHKNIEPKYHAMLLRASEQAKRLREYVLWFAAVDQPEVSTSYPSTRAVVRQPGEIFTVPRSADDEISGLTQLLYKGMPARVTERLMNTKNQVIRKLRHAKTLGGSSPRRS